MAPPGGTLHGILGGLCVGCSNCAKVHADAEMRADEMKGEGLELRMFAVTHVLHGAARRHAPLSSLSSMCSRVVLRLVPGVVLRLVPRVVLQVNSLSSLSSMCFICLFVCLISLFHLFVC